jgi:hypothetical protein
MKAPKKDFSPVIQGLPAMGGRQARLQGKMSKLTAGGTKTPMGKDLTKYNKAVAKNRKIDDARSSSKGYGTVTQAAESNNQPNTRFPSTLPSVMSAARQFGFKK